ncbi:MAG: AMMECR1 domain-containing protein, partial [Desulfobacterales bacterium]
METIRSNTRFTEKQGQLLVKLARNTILKELAGKSTNTKADTSILAFQDERFQAHCGTFVTLKIKGQLRGCIGNLTPEGSVLEGVKRNAVNAAFHDPRFSSISAAELDRTQIEVSILTEPLPL